MDSPVPTMQRGGYGYKYKETHADVVSYVE